LESALEFERLAEAAYTAMYDAPGRHAAKANYEDAAGYFARAIEAARAAGADAEAGRLTERLAHVTAVYNHQFRWI